ncbi:NAD(P)H-dependent oxidoreductase [Balneolaceae bacterium ANBcel3]|nr:NAD(P)H-dependent oxidoreductase [Balneolaceae bacterium ANBcel3]
MDSRINILSGTDRPGSNAKKVAEYLKPLYQQKGTRAEVVSLEDFPMEEVAGGKYGQDLSGVKAFRERVLDADGLVMVIPEYNGSFPGILKVFIDYLPFPSAFQSLPIAFVGEAAGAFGALRAVEQMQLICAYRNALIYPERVFLQRIGNIFDPEKGIKDEMTSKLLASQIEGFSTFVRQHKSEGVSSGD